MLYTILFCAFTTLVSARPKDQEIFRLSPELILKVHRFTVPCVEKYNADPELFLRLLEGTIPNDDVSKKWLICFSVSGKFTDENGHFNIHRMSGLLGSHPLVKPFEESLAECNKITKESPIETAYAMSKCINEWAPVIFSL